MPGRFEKHLQHDGSARWWDTKTNRYYDPGQYELVGWLAEGGTPTEVTYVAPPTAEELAVAHQAAKSADLKKWENAFLDLCAALGFQGKAGTTELSAVIEAMPDNIKTLKIAVRLLAIKDAIREYGGRFDDIPSTKHVS